MLNPLNIYLEVEYSKMHKNDVKLKMKSKCFTSDHVSKTSTASRLSFTDVADSLAK